MRIVPEEATPEMLAAAGRAVHDATYWAPAFAAMVRAAPASGHCLLPVSHAWLLKFIQWPPGTRVSVAADGRPHYIEGATGVVLTHSDDGCTLVSFDAPLVLHATRTKPADAWWAYTRDLRPCLV